MHIVNTRTHMRTPDVSFSACKQMLYVDTLMSLARPPRNRLAKRFTFKSGTSTYFPNSAKVVQGTSAASQTPGYRGR